MHVSIAGTTTHYQLIGSEGPFLVLLHGWGCDWQIWSPVISQLSEQFRLVIPDLPAFGQSSINDQVWDSYQYATWLELFVASVCESAPYSVAGHSFGGKIAALHAAQISQKMTASHLQLQKVVIIDASGLPVELTFKEKTTQTISKLIPQPLKRSFSGVLKKKLLNTIGVAADYQDANPEQQAILRKIVREDISQQLPLIEQETFVMWGENDQATPVEKGRMFAELVPNSRLMIYQNAGHYPFIDQPQAFLEDLAAFLQTQ